MSNWRDWDALDAAQARADQADAERRERRPQEVVEMPFAPGDAPAAGPVTVHVAVPEAPPPRPRISDARGMRLYLRWWFDMNRIRLSDLRKEDK